MNIQCAYRPVDIWHREWVHSIQACRNLRLFTSQMVSRISIFDNHSELTEAVNSGRAVITGKDSKFQHIPDLKGTVLGISRRGRQGFHLIYHCQC